MPHGLRFSECFVPRTMPGRRHEGGVVALLAALGLAAPAPVAADTIPDQRSFVWHQGDASWSSLPTDVANPFRGRFAPSGGTRYYENDPALPGGYDGSIDPLDPRIEPFLINVSPDTALNRTNRAKNNFPPTSTDPANTQLFQYLPPNFGGDYSGEVPCQDYALRSTGIRGRRQAYGQDENAGCIPGSGFDAGPDAFWGLNPGPDGEFGTEDDVFDDEDVVTEAQNVRLTGGVLELPFRPAPDLSVLDTEGNPDGELAQGLFVPSRGQTSGMAMAYERNVDLGTGRPLPGRLEGAPYQAGACVNAGEEDGTLGNTAFANNPLSMTVEQDITFRLGDGTPFSTIEDILGGIGTDEPCLKPGGGVEGVHTYTFNPDADENALQNHHANQGVFASLCSATIDSQDALDPGACAWTLYGSPRPSVGPGAIVGADFSLVEGIAYTLSGEADARLYGPFYAPIVSTQKGALNGPAPVLPVKGLSSLQVGAAGPVGRAECPPGSPDPDDCPGWDGLERTFVAQQDVERDFVSLDESLSNETRALAGCGPLYGTRCDSSRDDVLVYQKRRVGIFTVTDTYAAGGGLDLENGEASALLEAAPAGGRGRSTTGNDAQPGTVDFSGPPVCLRRDGSDEVRLPGCRGLTSFYVDGTGTPHADFEAGYLPSVDGCVIGSRIAGVEVEVTVDGEAPSDRVMAELDNCNTARVRRPVTADRPECEGRPRGPLPDGNPITGENFSAGEQLCNAVDTTLEELPLVHPLASCFADPDFDNPQFQRFAPLETRCNWQGRFQIDPATGNVIIAQQLLNPLRDADGNVGTVLAQLFRSESAALSWNFTMWLALTSCDLSSPDAEGNRVTDSEPGDPDAPDRIGEDPRCYFPKRPYAVERCSLANPKGCVEVQKLLGVTNPDPDGDGIASDGDDSGVVGDNRCQPGQVLGCDDNCSEVANPSQADANDNGTGNACDGDFDENGIVDGDDYDTFLACFDGETGVGVGPADDPHCTESDMTGDGFVGGPDYTLFADVYGGAPGPPAPETGGDGGGEEAPACGLGPELALLLPVALWLHRRRAGAR